MSNIIPISEFDKEVKKITHVQIDKAIEVIRAKDALQFINICYRDLFVLQFDWMN